MTLGSIVLALIFAGFAGIVAWVLSGTRARAQSQAALEGLRLQLGKKETELESATLQLDQIKDESGSLRTQVQSLQVQLAELRVAQQTSAEKLSWLDRAQDGMRDAFQALAGQSLKENSEQWISRAQQTVMEPVSQHLSQLDRYIRELEQKREGAYAGITEQISGLLQANQSLQQQTTTLSSALRSSQVRGRWGELQLRRIAEMSGMDQHINFDEQVAVDDESRPDMIVYLPNGGQIPLDAKAPMSSYFEAVESSDDGVRQIKLQDHARAMRGRVRELSQRRYWDRLEKSTDFVVMFVPSESCMSAALAIEPALLEDAIRDKVMLATPTTLLALLKTVAFGWQQMQISENAHKIAEEARELHQRMLKFADHSNKLSKQLKNAVEAHNDMVGSIQLRVMPKLRRMEELAGADKAFEISEPISIMPRMLNESAESAAVVEAD